MRWVWSAVVYVLALAASAATAFVLVLWLAGPHGGVLPDDFRPLVLGLGWLAVLGLPVWAARVAWRWLGRVPGA